MTTSALTHLLAVVGTALYVLRAAPAAISLVRSGRPDPSGAPTFGLLFLTGVWWTGYSLEIGNWPSFVAATLSLLAPGVALLLLFRLREVRRSLVLLLLTGAAVTLLEEEFAPRAVGVTAAVGTAAIALPQAVRLLRDPAASVADVSLGTWVLLTANAFVWLVYGYLIGHPLLGAAGVVQLPASFLVFRRALAERSGRGAAPPARAEQEPG